MSRSQGNPLTKDEIQRVQKLLADTDMTMAMNAERMNCSLSSIAKINKEFQIRSYNGQRTRWATASESVSAGHSITRASLANFK